MASPFIDAHHHFWDPDRGDYDWISGPFQPIRRIFGPEDLAPSIAEFGIAGTVLVQTWHSLDESWDYLAIADRTPFVAGVVAWVDLTDPKVDQTLAALRASVAGKWLVGIRHLLHLEADADWLLRSDVRRGLAAVAEAGLVYDLVGNTTHLPAMLRTVTDFPTLRFVLDHIAKPDIKGAVREPWTTLMRGFSPHRNHVWCKLSGMITEADWENWSPDDLRPYVLEALDIFGPDRCMFGTDWPVCLVAGSYAQVIGALRSCLTELNETQRNQIFGRSAIEAYNLPDFRNDHTSK
jgi:L-fuconolactonase